MRLSQRLTCQSNWCYEKWLFPFNSLFWKSCLIQFFFKTNAKKLARRSCILWLVSQVQPSPWYCLCMCGLPSFSLCFKLKTQWRTTSSWLHMSLIQLGPIYIHFLKWPGFFHIDRHRKKWESNIFVLFSLATWTIPLRRSSKQKSLYCLENELVLIVAYITSLCECTIVTSEEVTHVMSQEVVNL